MWVIFCHVLSKTFALPFLFAYPSNTTTAFLFFSRAEKTEVLSEDLLQVLNSFNAHPLNASLYVLLVKWF